MLENLIYASFSLHLLSETSIFCPTLMIQKGLHLPLQLKEFTINSVVIIGKEGDSARTQLWYSKSLT